MANEAKQELKLKILLEQTAGARMALAFYRRARMRSMCLGSLAMLVLVVLGYTKYVPVAALALPFAVIYLLVQHAYLTHLVHFGRTHLAELEGKVNAELGETVLMTEALESKESGPVGESNFLGVSAGNITGIYSVTTIHYLLLCAAMFVAGLFRTHYVLGQPELRPVETFGKIYSPVLLIWAIANILYLVWFSWGEAEKTVIAGIRKQFQSKGE